MKSNELTMLELIATGETENEDVSGNQGDPWYTRQDD